MKKTIWVVCTIALYTLITFCGCSDNAQSHIQEMTDSMAILNQRIVELESQVKQLQYPADVRLKDIKEKIANDNLDDAIKKINELCDCFPYSDEAKESKSLVASIKEKKEAIENEKKRIKALGFKALGSLQNVTIGDNKIIFSNFKVGQKYTHDVYPTYSGTEWREHTADRGSSFISCNMDITSSSKDPKIPTIAFYSVDGEKLIHQKDFWVNFARWSDYGCYLGNEPDLKNDFSKVSTVKFRVGAQLEDIYFKKPYVIVLKKANTLSRHYDRFENPPVSYYGDASYPSTLTIDNFNNGKYVALKIANL